MSTADLRSERAVIACLLEPRGEDLPASLAAAIRRAPASFEDARYGQIALAIRTCIDEGNPVYAEDIAARLNFEGVTNLVLELAAQAVSLELGEVEAKRVLENHERREIRRQLNNAVIALGDRPQDFVGIVNGVRDFIDNFGSNGDVPLITARNLFDIPRPKYDDENELLRSHFLDRGAGMILCGPTGIGKSSFSMQAIILWAIGKPCFGITPTRPLKSLLIQAENGDGDLAEMRDGVIAGLNLSEADIAQAKENIKVICEDSRTSTVFFMEVVAPLLEAHRPDLLWIDPALAYLGGEANAQKDVSAFLRNGLNPLLHKFKCGCVIVHHTNKPPSGKEKSTWQAGDFAYLGSGSAEWANWARAVIAIRSVGSRDVFELQAGKRGGRLGWKEPDGSKAYTKYIAHATEPGVICWREVEAEDAKQGGRPKAYDVDEFLALLPDGGLTAKEWQESAKAECGLSEATFHRERRALQKADRIIKAKASGKWQPVKKS